MKPASEGSRLEIGVLYGARAIMVACVAAFHFYQQTWIGQVIDLFGYQFDLSRFNYSGYMFVDGLLLLSGFLLYLPYAREVQEGIPAAGAKAFYYRRAKRILPSYWAAILLSFFLIALPQAKYGSFWEGAWDLFTHMTFLQMFDRATYLFSPLNGAVWTIAVEVQFYLIFPLLARAAQKKPVLTLGGMALLGWAYRWAVGSFCPDTAPLVNQMPAYLDVYALGMLGAMLYCAGRQRYLRADRLMRRAVSIAATAGLLLSMALVIALVNRQTGSISGGYEGIRLSQMRLELPVAGAILAAMLCGCLALKPVRWLFSNRLMRFLAAISMNFYIWHQLIAVQIREHWIPDIDALHADPNRQVLYTLLCWLASFAVAMAFTYGLEWPCARLMDRAAARRARRKACPHTEGENS